MTHAEMARIHAAAFVVLRPWTEVEFSDLCESPLIFHVAPNPACFALGRVIAGEAELLTIATHPDTQRQGHARICLEAFLDHCRGHHCESVFLEVEENNHAALALYSKAGFQITGQRTGYYRLSSGARSDAVLMAKHLKG